MRRIRLAVVLAALLGVTGATAAEAAHQDKSLCYRAFAVRVAVIKAHGRRAPGRNICRQGIRFKYVSPDRTRRHWATRSATKHEKVRYMRALRRLIAPPPAYLVRVAVPPGQPPAGTLSATVAAGGTLQAIANCESHGNPRAISPDGRYRGKYQFDYGTWGEVGGSGDPAAASEQEQDRRAAILYQRAGPGRWPVCGR